MTVEPVPTGPQQPGDLTEPPPAAEPPPEGWDIFMDNLTASLAAILAASPDEAVTP